MKIASHVEGTKAAVYVDGIAEGMTQEQVEEAIRQTLEAQPAAGPWVSVEDALPEDEDYVLVNIKQRMGVFFGWADAEGEWRILFFSDRHAEWEFESNGCTVDYWMPLPEPPEEEER